AGTFGGGSGNVRLNAASVTLDRGAALLATTSGTGVGGNVRIEATDQIILNGDGARVGATGVLAETRKPQSNDLQLPVGTRAGAGGNVTLRAGDVNLMSGARVSSASTTTGDAGSVSVRAVDRVTLRSGSSIASSGGDFAKGGDVTIRAMQLSLDHSSITAQAANNAQVKENGGDVD